MTCSWDGSSVFRARSLEAIDRMGIAAIESDRSPKIPLSLQSEPVSDRSRFCMLADNDAPVLSEPELPTGFSSLDIGVGSVSARARLPTVGELGAGAAPAYVACRDINLEEVASEKGKG